MSKKRTLPSAPDYGLTLPDNPLERSVIDGHDKISEGVEDGNYVIRFGAGSEYPAGTLVCEPATCPELMPLSEFRFKTFIYNDVAYWDTGELTPAKQTRQPRMTVAEADALAQRKAEAKRLDEDAVIAHALLILGARLRDPNERTLLDEPDLVMNYLRLKVGPCMEKERFGILWLDGAFRLIADDTLAEGKVSEAHVDMKEVMRRAIHHNAQAAICYHNHPSGDPDPSDNDKAFTGKLAELLEMLEVRLVDHLIVGNSKDMPIASMRMQAKAEEEAEEQEKKDKHPLQRLLESLQSGDAEVKVIHGQAGVGELLNLMLALKAMRGKRDN